MTFWVHAPSTSVRSHESVHAKDVPYNRDVLKHWLLLSIRLACRAPQHGCDVVCLLPTVGLKRQEATGPQHGGGATADRRQTVAAGARAAVKRRGRLMPPDLSLRFSMFLEIVLLLTS